MIVTDCKETYPPYRTCVFPYRDARTGDLINHCISRDNEPPSCPTKVDESGFPNMSQEHIAVCSEGTVKPRVIMIIISCDKVKYLII